MSLFKTLILSNQTKVLLKTQNPLYKILLPPPHFVIRTFNSSPEKPTKKPLSLWFQEAVDITEKFGGNEIQGENEGENNELLRGLRELEREFRNSKGKPKGKKKEGEEEKEKEREKPKKVKSLVELKKEKEGLETEKPKKTKSLVELFGGAKKEEKVKEVGKVQKVRRKGEEVKEVANVQKVRRKGEEIGPLKDFSHIAETFIRHLYAKGYFDKANFW